MFVDVFSSVDSPLTKLNQEKVKFQLSDECEKIFYELRTTLTTTPILTLTEGSNSYVIYCDISKIGVGCVLMQRGMVIDYSSRYITVMRQTIRLMILTLQSQYFP